MKENQPATSISFEKSLTNYQLSKFSKLKPRDRQGRRSRDHLTTCTHLGLLNRSLDKNEYHYQPSPIGEKLGNYNFREECPKDINEMSIFSTSLLTLKLVNGHYTDPTFRKLRIRPFVSILYALQMMPLHINQLYFYVGKVEKDVVLSRSEHVVVLEKVGRLSYKEKGGIEQFNKDLKMTEADIDEVNRSIRPWITWGSQVGLFWLDDEGVCHPTQKGNVLLQHFLKVLPLWYLDLGVDKARKSVLLLLLQVCSLENKKLPKNFLNSCIEFPQRSFTTPENLALLQDLQKKFGILNKDYSSLKMNIHFDFYSDVPPEYQHDVLLAYNEYAKELGIHSTVDSIQLATFDKVRSIIKDTPEERELLNLTQYYGFTPPRKELFKVEFEYQSCLVLRRLGFNADKYQGNLSELVRISLKNFVENNPDILVSNDIAFLIECKSKEEWSERSSFNKRILGELKSYQDYAEEVKANSAIILVESEFSKEEFFLALVSELQKLDKVLMVSHSYLVESVNNLSFLQRLKSTATNPSQYQARDRVLVKSATIH
ncbi:MAG: hypothetical protein HYZ34_08395 [Ignavibacteriae bacterium]|nr:hypothetical protein [Ignavibacteriota bacterium]